MARPSAARRGAWWRPFAVLLAAVVLTLASTAVQRMRLEVQDWDCPPSPASCARPVLVAGFPAPFLSDRHGLSVVGRVDLVGGLLGEDRFDGGAFALDVAVYALLVLGGWSAVRRLRRGAGNA